MDGIGKFIGQLFSFNSSLKLYHWEVTGRGSYAQHIALDQAIESVLDHIDRIVETSIAKYGDLGIEIPKTVKPENIVDACTSIRAVIEKARSLFPDSSEQAILDDYDEAILQLMYRLIRLK